MRYTTTRNGKNVIPLLNAVCGIDLPYWRIDRADGLHSYLSGDAADRLADYEAAEEQGRLVILPCKVGDTLFVPSQGTILEGTVDKISVSGREIYVFSDHDSANWVFTPVNFGETVFLSREAAEAALKGESKDV